MHIMLDLETLGTATDSVVLAIGAVTFDPQNTLHHNMEFYVKLSIFDQLLLGRKVYESAVEWWKKQSAVAQDEFRDTNIVGVVSALTDLNQWIDFVAKDQENDLKFWAKSPSFDMAIMDRLYEVSDALLKPRWTYRNQFDVRTAELVADSKGPRAPTTIKHNAISDCYAQIETVKAAFMQGANHG